MSRVNKIKREHMGFARLVTFNGIKLLKPKSSGRVHAFPNTNLVYAETIYHVIHLEKWKYLPLDHL